MQLNSTHPNQAAAPRTARRGKSWGLLCTAALTAVATIASAAAPATPQGVITAKAFLDINGTAVTDLTGNAKFPGSPDAVYYQPYFEWNANGDITVNPAEYGNNYGAQMVGYFYPPVTGSYVFFLAADDGANLYLSTDDTAANKKLIAQEAGYSGIRSWDVIGGTSTVEAKNSSTFATTEWPTKDPNWGGAAITLTANRAYYIEALVKEGGGGDHLAVAVQDPNGMIDAYMPIPGEYLSSFDKATGPLQIVTQPVSVTANEGAPAVFSVVVNGTPPYTYEWKKNGVAIADVPSTAYAYTIDRVSADDNGAKFAVTITGASGSLTSSEATLTVNSDNAAPTLASAAGSSSFDSIIVTFSEPLDPTTAETASNYKLSGGLTVSAAQLVGPAGGVDDHKVILTTSAQTEGAAVTLTVSNVKDIAGNTIAANSTLDLLTAKLTTGWASYERWHNEVADPGDINAFAAAIVDGTIRLADYSSALPQFGGFWGARDNYSGRVSGFFIPPSNGNYVFFLSADDQAILYLSTDENPANRKIIARESSYSGQNQFTTTSASILENKRSDQFSETEWPEGVTITLQAGKKYYMEALWDEGGGGDGADVTYKLESEPDPTNDAAGMRMKGNVIATYLNPNGASVTFAAQPASTTSDVNRTATFSVVATGASAYGSDVTYQWQKANSGSSNFADIAGANADSYTTPSLQLTDSGSQYRVVASVPTFSLNSSAATLTVVQDITPPTVVGVGATPSQTGSTFDVGVAFDEKVEAASASNAANYTLSAGTVSEIKMYEGSPGVILTVSGLTVGNPYTLTVANVVDLFGNKLVTTEEEFVVSTMKWGVVGGSEVGAGNAVLAVGEGGFDVYSDGIGEWAAYDEATFVYEEITGDFDKKLRVEFQDASSQWARAGLVARDVTNFGVDRTAQEGGAAGRYQKVHVNPVGPTLTGPGTGGNASWEGNRRLATGAATTTAGNSTGVIPQYPNAWVRMQRKGDLFTIYRSDDGVAWTQLGTTTFDEPMPAKLFVGPEYSPENGNITEEASRGMFVAKFRDYGDTFPPYSIGLNFGADQADGAMAAVDVAGAPAVAQPNWNNLPSLSGSTNKVTASVNGGAEDATVTVAWASNNLWSSTGAGEENNGMSGADKILMTGYLDTEAATTTTVTITGLPSELTTDGYDVYVYTLGGTAAGRSGGYRVLDAATQAVLKDYVFATSLTSPTAYVETPVSTDSSNPAPGTHIVFRGLTAAGIVVEATTANGLGGGSPARAPINAVQLVTPATEAGDPVIPTGSASIVRTAAGASITYTGTLESADSVTGPWTPVAGAVSPYAVTITGAAKFYRVQ